MIPRKVPHELEGLSQLEEMLVARVLPIIRVYLKPGGQRAYSGHCINFAQNVGEIAKMLPHYSKDLPVVIVRMNGKDNTFKDVIVRRQKVLDALNWLMANNPHYGDLQINCHSLNCLPLNGVPSDLPTVESETETSNNDYNLGPESNINDIVHDEHSEMSSFMPAPSLKKQEEDAVRQQFSSSPTVSWPTLDSEPLSEFATPFLATLAFPTLFPDGQGDPTNPSLMRDVEFAENVKHLLKFAEVKSGKWFYRFETHPRFSYWALNMIQRRRALGQASFFIKQNPGEAHLSVEELQQMANNATATNLMSKISSM